MPGRASRQVRSDLGTPQPGRIPRHIRKLPRHPAQLGAVGREPGGGEEVMAAGQKPRRGTGAVHGHRNQVVDHGVSAVVGLPDAGHPTPVGAEHRISEPDVPRLRRPGRQRSRIRAAANHPQPLVSPVREHDRGAVHAVAPAAVLVDPGTDRESGRCHLHRFRSAGRRRRHQDHAASLARAGLDPVDPPSFEGHVRQPDRRLDQQSRSDRRRPGTVRCCCHVRDPSNAGTAPSGPEGGHGGKFVR